MDGAEQVRGILMKYKEGITSVPSKKPDYSKFVSINKIKSESEILGVCALENNLFATWGHKSIQIWRDYKPLSQLAVD